MEKQGKKEAMACLTRAAGVRRENRATDATQVELPSLWSENDTVVLSFLRSFGGSPLYALNSPYCPPDCIPVTFGYGVAYTLVQLLDYILLELLQACSVSATMYFSWPQGKQLSCSPPMLAARPPAG